MTDRHPVYTISIVLIGCLLATSSAEPVNVQECTDSATSVGPTPEKITCEGMPVFEVFQQPASVLGLYTEITGYVNIGFFSIGAYPNLIFKSLSQCPVEMSVDDLKCGALTVSMASSPTETNGAPTRVNGEGAFGLVTWSCEADPETLQMKFHFYMETVANDADSDFDADGTAFLRTLFDTTGNEFVTTGASDLKVAQLQKFSYVTSDTEIYYIKELSVDDQTSVESTVHHIIFKSTATTVKISTGQYDAIKDPTGLTSGHTMPGMYTAPICSNSYQVFYKSSKKSITFGAVSWLFPVSFIIIDLFKKTSH